MVTIRSVATTVPSHGPMGVPALLHLQPGLGRCVRACGLLRGSMAPAEPQAAASPIAPAGPSIWGGLLRRFGWLIVAGIFVMGSVVFATQRNDAGEITSGGSLAISELQVGDCFDPKNADAEEAEEVDTRRCDEPHQFEMVAIGTMPEGAYPAEVEFENFVGAVCLPAFDEYVGLAYEESRLEVAWYFPIEDGWNDGDRTIQCAITDPLENQLTESLRGAAR